MKNTVTLYWFPDLGALGVDEGGPYINIWHANTLEGGVQAYQRGAPDRAVNVLDYATGARRAFTVEQLRSHLTESDGSDG